MRVVPESRDVIACLLLFISASSVYGLPFLEENEDNELTDEILLLPDLTTDAESNYIDELDDDVDISSKEIDDIIDEEIRKEIKNDETEGYSTEQRREVEEILKDLFGETKKMDDEKRSSDKANEKMNSKSKSVDDTAQKDSSMNIDKRLVVPHKVMKYYRFVAKPKFIPRRKYIPGSMRQFIPVKRRRNIPSFFSSRRKFFPELKFRYIPAFRDEYHAQSKRMYSRPIRIGYVPGGRKWFINRIFSLKKNSASKSGKNDGYED